MASLTTLDLSYRHIFAIAIPVTLANLAMPIQSAIDVAVVGHFDTPSSLAGLGIAVQLLMLILVSLNFLQYASSGLAAQALGKLQQSKLENITQPEPSLINDQNQKDSKENHSKQSHSKENNRQHSKSTPSAINMSELTHILQRSLLLAVFLSVLLLICRPILVQYGLLLLAASADNKVAATTYLDIRLLGVSFELINYVFIGWFAGQGLSKYMLYQQSCIAVCNVALTLFFVYVMGLGLTGVALGTVLAYIFGTILAVYLATRHLGISFTQMLKVKSEIIKRSEMLRLFSLNKDIFIRTLLLTLSLTWITRLSALQGDLVLATNAVLLQVLAMSAYALDGVAVATESLSGQAVSYNNTTLFQRAVYRTGVVIFALALFLSIVWYTVTPTFITLMTDIEAVIDVATDYRVTAALLPLIGAGAYWLDGIMFGLTAGKLIRRAAIVTALLFFPLSFGLYHYLSDRNLAMWAIWLSVYSLLLLRFAVNAVILWRNQALLLNASSHP